MNESQLALLNRILASQQFANTITLGRILRYVCEKTEGTEDRVKEYEIAVDVLGRHPSFDPKLDPVVRVSMKGIRERLQRYFEDTEQHESLRLVIPRGVYRAEFAESRRATGESQDGAHVLRQFWSSYLGKDRPNLLVHTEPLFFREGWATYVRNLYVNDPIEGSQMLLDQLPELRARQLIPSYHYLDAGEVHSMFLLMSFFQEMGVSAAVRNARIASWQELRQSNMILVGCTRTNSFMDMLQEETDFVIGEDEIRIPSPSKGEQLSYRGERYQDSKLARYREYVLVSRRPGASPNSTITMIAANHGRAIEGAVSQLTSASDVSKLLSMMGVDSQSTLPRRFQILLQVEMIDLDDEIVGVEYVSHRMPAD